MKKYWQIFKISFQQEFAYKLSFIIWRLRSILQVAATFFLWDAAFSNPGRTLFGYSKAQILTYVFGVLIVRAFVLSARAVDVAGEVANGDLSNYLIKPVSYFKYWLTRDLASKALNLFFAFFETLILYLIIRPPFFLQTNAFYLITFFASLFFAMFIFFTLLFMTSTVPFWMPEVAWGAQFLVVVVVIEFLSGSLFPIDILPAVMQKVLYALPFPYLIFFPLQTYLGKLPVAQVMSGLLVSLCWSVILWLILKFIWSKGLKVYQAYGR